MAANSQPDESGQTESSPKRESVCPLSDCIARNEAWLINRNLHYAKNRGFNQPIATLQESCKLSISHFSKSIIAALKRNPENLELPSEEEIPEDSIAALGIVEAARHREHGVDPCTSLALLKYSRRTYLDLLTEAVFDSESRESCRTLVDRFFDRVEMGLFVDWMTSSQNGIDHVARDNTMRKRTEEALRRRMSDLREGVREWNCLLAASNLMAQHDRPLDDILKEIVQTVPHGWRYPDSACARIVLREREYITPNFKETAWKQDADILDSAERVGSVEIYYLGKKQDADEGPFLKEERILIDELARRIGFLFERKRMVETLRESEGKYRTLFEDSRDSIVITTREGYFVDVNMAALELFGYSREELMGMNILDLYDNALDGYHIQKEIEKRSSLKDFRLKFRKKDGTEKDCLFNGTLRWGEDGRILGYQGIIRDVTEQRRALEELERINNRNRLLLESAGEGIFGLDSQGRVTFVNPQAGEMFGYSMMELKGLSAHSLIHHTKPNRMPYPEEDCPIYMACKDGAVHHAIDEVFWRKDGTTFPVEFTSTPIFESKELVGAVVTFQDVTERQELERQLRQAQKMEAIGTLAGGIAHDFNNILGVIMGCTELSLLHIPEQNPVHKHMMQVYKAGTRARDLVRQILAVSRRTEQERKPVQPAVIIKEALKMLRASLPSTIQIQQHIRKDTGIILADPTQIHQVLMNLCTNAAQAMRDKGGILTVNLSDVVIDGSDAEEYPQLKPGPYLRLTVADTGHGMDRRVRERIFEPYFTTKEPGEGTGLGLAVAYGIVKSYQGTLKVHSEPGRGSVFHVLLPRVEYVEGDRGKEAPGTLPVGHERILLVDDEQTLVQAMQEMLEYLGYRVTPKTSSTEALEVFQSQSDAYDLVITDQTMPYMTGVDLAKEILLIRPDIPIVLCTGFSEQVNEKKAIAWGIRAFLFKPIFIQQIAGTIRNVLDRADAHRRSDSI